MVSVVLGIGSNLGDRFHYIHLMEKELCLVLSGPILKSDLMETEPVNVDHHQWFLNRIISGSYDGTALELLDRIEIIEVKLGRDKKSQLAPRTADIDILLFGEEIINTAILTIPHPQIINRRYCLEGMNQIVGNWLIPGKGRLVSEHFNSMNAQIKAQKIRFLHEKGSDFSNDRT